MDRRTELLIDALAHPGASFLFHLLQGGALVEDELLELVPDTSQSTANRRLQRLGDLGLLIREPGPRQYRDRPWTVVVPDAASAFIISAMALARAMDQVDEKERNAAEEILRGKPKRRNLKAV